MAFNYSCDTQQEFTIVFPKTLDKDDLERSGMWYNSSWTKEIGGSNMFFKAPLSHLHNSPHPEGQNWFADLLLFHILLHTSPHQFLICISPTWPHNSGGHLWHRQHLSFTKASLLGRDLTCHRQLVIDHGVVGGGGWNP